MAHNHYPITSRRRWGSFMRKAGERVARAHAICSQPGCPQPATTRGRCPHHARQMERHQRRTVPTKIDRQRTQRQRQDVVKQWVKRFGWVCPGYKRDPHESHDLTAQHGHALIQDGDNDQALTVLCRSCNSRHGIDSRHQNDKRYQ